MRLHECRTSDAARLSTKYRIVAVSAAATFRLSSSPERVVPGCGRRHPTQACSPDEELESGIVLLYECRVDSMHSSAFSKRKSVEGLVSTLKVQERTIRPPHGLSLSMFRIRGSEAKVQSRQVAPQALMANWKILQLYVSRGAYSASRKANSVSCPQSLPSHHRRPATPYLVVP